MQREIVFSLLLWSPIWVAFAQEGPQFPPAPPSALPGRVPQQIELPSELQSVPGPLIETLPSLKPPPGAETVRLKLSSVEVTEATVYQETELLPYYEELLGTEVTLQDVFEIAQAITDKYRNDGYILAQAVVPAGQKLNPNGARVTLRVVEGYIDEIVYEDSAFQQGDQGRLIRAYLEKIPESCRVTRPKDANTPCPLHKDVLERYLLLVKDLPGVDVESVLIKGDAPGSASLYVTVTQELIEAFGAIDNRGTKWVGPVQVSAGFRRNFANFHTTELQLRAATDSDELKLVNLTHSIPIGTEGGILSFFGSYSKSRPGFTLNVLDLETDNYSFLTGYEFPLIRTREKNLSVFTDFRYLEQETEALNNTLVDDRLSVLSAGLRFDNTDALGGGGVNLVEFRISQGLNIFNATQRDAFNASRLGGDPTFTKVFGYFARLQRISSQSSLQLQVSGQYAFDRLFVPVQFGYGGVPFGRAYDSSELIGDSGAALSAEYRYTPEIRGTFLKVAQFYAYYDIGAVWQRDSSCGCTDDREDGSGASLGGGVRVNFSRRSSGYLEIAKPLTREVAAEGNKDPRLFFSFSLRY